MLQCKALRTYYDVALNKLALLLVYSINVIRTEWIYFNLFHVNIIAFKLEVLASEIKQLYI